MAEPFKNRFRPETVRRIADRIKAAGSFDADAFYADAIAGLDALELKDRVRHITRCLGAPLPAASPDALDHLLRALGTPSTTDEANGRSFGLLDFQLLT